MIKFHRVDGNFTDKPLHRLRTFILNLFKILKPGKQTFGLQTGSWKEHTDHPHSNNKHNT